MKMTAKSCYSILAATALAEAHAQPGLVSVSKLAERIGAPRDFLVQVLQLLRHAGVVASVRGVAGGYRLAAPPGEITVGRVLRASEGRGGHLEPAAACARAVEKAGRSRTASGRALGLVLSEAERALNGALDRLTLAAVLERAATRAAAAPNYQI
jgi:Rrf2 family protein